MARSRGLNVTITGDATQLQRAFQRSEAAAKQFGTTTDRVHGGVKKRAEEAVTANAALTGSFRGMARAAVTAGAGFAAAYVGISKAKDAIKATEDLAHTTENLHRNFGLTTKAASSGRRSRRSTTSPRRRCTWRSRSCRSRSKASRRDRSLLFQAFKDLGLSQKDLKGLNFQQVLARSPTG
jgi:hypothetical protein